MIRFGYTILYVQDVKKSMAFYEAAFGFERVFITPEGDYGQLNTGATALAFASTELARTNLPDGYTESSLSNHPFAMELGFVTQDVEETVKQALSAGAVIVSDPRQKPWGQTVAYLRDIDGFLIEVCTPIV